MQQHASSKGTLEAQRSSDQCNEARSITPHAGHDHQHTCDGRPTLPTPTSPASQSPPGPLRCPPLPVYPRPPRRQLAHPLHQKRIPIPSHRLRCPLPAAPVHAGPENVGTHAAGRAAMREVRWVCAAPRVWQRSTARSSEATAVMPAAGASTAKFQQVSSCNVDQNFHKQMEGSPSGQSQARSTAQHWHGSGV